MKLTKKQENIIWQVYDTWLYSYLNGDVKTYNKYLDKDYHFIGSTDNEEFLNKKDTTNFFKSTADQLAGKCDLRNETKIIEQFEGLVFITHLFDAWFKINNDYAYYGRFRFTNALKENNEGWRFIYQHFSTTDSKTDKGETIGFDKVSAENQELREAIKRRTFELEQKNRELEVETALERIRAKAVAMKASSDLLDIVVTMRNEFIKLGHEAHYFWHMMWLPKTYEKAMTSGDGSKIGFVMELPRHIHGDIPLLAKWEKSKKPTVVYAMNVDEALDYVDKMVSLGDFKNIDPQAPTAADIRHVGGLTFIMAKTTHGEIGYSLPGIVKNPPKEDIDILVKFAGAFDLAHKRFLDLQKAEKQAKETQIDLSLERIRSRVTAMQESSDLFEIVVAMRNEFISLGHQADYFWHMKWLEDNYEMSMTAEDGGRLGMVITVPKFVHEQIESLYKWEKSNSPYFVLALNGKEAWDYIEKMNTYGKYKLVDPYAPTEEDILHIRGLTFIIARTTHGEIGFSLAGKVENPPKASIDILVRFANVFDLAYKRFEDLQKAEKQARETQIELALEKVRSRTMAMQHSDELQEASFLLDQQVRELGIKTWGCAFNIYGEKESTEWFGNEAGVLHTYTVPREGIFKEYYDKGQKGETLFIQEFSGEECVAHYEYMSSLPVIGDVLKTLKKRNNGFPTYQIDHVVFFKYGYLLFITRESVSESHDVFKRFAKVFEQTYTRFLDLQKAEAQARESEIELALERVRARTLAMQHSDELAETAALLFKQINDLGIETWTSGFNIWEKNDASFIGYNPTPSGDITAPYQIPSTEDSFFKKIHKAKKNGEAFLVFKASGKSLVKTYDYMKTLPVVKDVLQGIEDSGTQLPKSQINHSAFFSHGFLLFITLEPYPEAHGIFKRFAKVFEQTYTRFLDLQKAEAQAREAQIEAALERVRSRSMAMHKSEELLEAGALLYSELSKLGIKHLTTGYILFNEKAEIGYSYGVNPADGSIRHQPVAMIHNQTKTMKTIVASWKKQEPLLVIELNEKETIKHQTFIAEKSTNFPLTAAQLLAISPQRLVIHCFNFKQGYLLIVGGIRLIIEQQEMVVRFAKVFQQTYTRFLDLQRAETQAREAQIEAAFERVRSASMAMHKSEEMQIVVDNIYEQLDALNFEMHAVGMSGAMDPKKGYEVWAGGIGLKAPLQIPYSEATKVQRDYNKVLIERTELFAKTYKGKIKKEYIDFLLHNNKFPPFLEKLMVESKAFSTTLATSKNSGIQILRYTEKPYTDTENSILLRFAKVFEQAYIRFMDLQKAENQAREAQIEAALERVRSRSMAMHKSEEIGDVAFVLFEQLKSLGGELWGTGFGFCKTDSKVDEFWFANEKGIMPHLKIPNDVDEAHKKMYQGWKNKLELFSIEKGGKELKDHYKYMLKVPDVQPIFQGMLDNGIKFPKWQKWHAAYFKYGYMLVITTQPYQNETIFKRFAKVFEQAYTRFLDLQKAEAQARESQIQLALERVRARTMAMQSSEELIETSELLFQQIKELGIEVWSCGYSLWYDDDSYFIGYNPMPNGKMGPTFKIPLTEDIFFKTIRKAKREGKEFLVFESKGKSLVKTYEYMDTLPVVGEAMRAIVDSGYELPKYQVTHCGFFAHGHLMFITHQHYPEAHDIFKRFTKEFEQTYSRFLDLQKAEALAREAQIEAALERVRSRSMAMHNSEELKEVIQVLYDQFIHLNIKIEHAGFILDYKENDDMHIWLADHNAVFPKIVLPYFDCAHWNSFIEAKNKGQQFFANTLGFEEKNKFYKDLFQFIPDLPEETKKTYLAFKGLAISTVLLDNVGLYIENYSGTPFSEEDNKILMRFGKVFQQSYTRFLDLQKAEAQAREAQIETALERVRSQSMGMQTSKDLSRVTTEMFNQLRQFGGDLFATGIVFCDKHEGHVEQWHSLPDAGMMSPFIVPIDLDYIHQFRYDEWKKGTELFSVEIPSDFIEQHFQDIFNLPSAQKVLKDFEDQNTPMPKAPPWEIDYGASFKHGYMLVSSLQPFKEKEILPRFAKVFEQAYTRFLDLQKAEAQARESQIEAALEKVRSRSLAMHNANELTEVVVVIVEKLKELGVILDANGITLCTYFPNSKDVLHWIASPDFSHVGKYLLPYFEHVIFKEAWQSKEQGDSYFSKAYSIKDKNSFFEYAFEHSDYKNFPEEFKQWIFNNDKHVLSFAWQKNSAILIPSNTGVLLTDDEKEILIRFSKVFEQAYIRFMDLQKAETQARKAQIEASLERVRAKAMSMQNSDELDEVLSVLCEQFDVLGIVPMSTHMTVFDFENNTFTFRETGKFGNRSFGEQTVALDAMDNWKETVEKWKADEATAINKLHFPKEQLPTVWEVFHESFASMPEGSRITPNDYPDGIYHTAGKHPFGYIGMNQIRPATEEEEQIVIKFANEFGMAYQRFLDLKKAEAQAREAQIETALEKVRSRTMAMQHSDELPEAANNLFLQVQALGIPAWSAGYCIWEDESKKSAWCNMSSEGEIQKGFSLPTIGEGYNFYNPIKKNEDFHVAELGGKALVKHYDFMKKLPIVGEILLEFSQKGIALPIFQIFHIVFFTHGYLMFITYEAVPNEWDIFKRFGKVFEQTYTRFLDLRKAEAQSDLIKKEKERLEVTLSELKATQSQLIQSEKMASLGELTAGIAHEIQNPLNFVNNFSEVSKELLDEMLEEIENGDMEEVRAIMNDVIQNLEKINHHGKRADGIVKGMLQHSRSSSGTKEPVNINVLADEYLRLAYHGLRAKDKSFNATLVTDFDDTIGNIKIIPQDIGRVVLNLLTNAFYVVNEKKQSNKNGYDPTVSLSTKKNGKWVTITVKDNGNGIPKHVLEKIFQPFFTTKPTGQGTGLGLSMSYDIVTKGHGGELKVNTEQNKGTEFIIKLPI